MALIGNKAVTVRPIHMWVAECSCGWRQTHKSEENARWDGDEHAHGHTDDHYALVVLTAGAEERRD